ncbi:MAG: response regulator [Leptolyngbya sp. SIO4C1]|nr:response regulator [Leptolyngbya sp. SIO4C1]
MSFSHPKSILLIDDNPNDRLLARRELDREFEDLNIIEAIDQQELNQKLNAANFDMVITDYQLGWSNGLTVLRTVKAQHPQCPVIMFTNTGTEEIAVEAMKAGLDDYVIKSPKHFIRLPQAVRSVWQKVQTQRRAAQLEGRLQALLNQLEVGIFRAMPTGQLLDVNAALLNMLQVDSLESAQSRLGQRLAMPNQPPADRLKPKEMLLERQDDRPMWLRLIMSVSAADRGEPIVDGIVEDITGRKQAEQALSELNQTLEEQVQARTAQLESANRELELFAYSVSHDLRSPVRQIDGFINLLSEQLAEPPDSAAQHYLTIISDLITRAGNMIDALLNFSRTGRVEMSPTQVDMLELVETVKAQIKVNEPDRTIQWQIEPLPAVWCDRTLMQTVWQNLLENAVKFTRFEPVAKITVGSQAQGQSTVFFVKDNGVGFDAHQAEKIFGIFQQAHSSRDFEGTGIGLANAQRIIARHRGRIWADGQRQQGAAFYFSLPNDNNLREPS